MNAAGLSTTGPGVGRLVQPADQLGLVVGLADLDLEPELARPIVRTAATRSS